MGEHATGQFRIIGNKVYVVAGDGTLTPTETEHRGSAFIPIQQIEMDHHPLNPSTLGLVTHLAGGGEVPPIHVQSLVNGRYRICDGRHRVTAYKLLGYRHIEARYSIRTEKENARTA